MFRHLYQPSSERRFRWFNRFSIASFGLILAIVPTTVMPAHAQSVRSARIVEIIDTPDTQRVLINQSRARAGYQASLGQRVLTEQAARTGLLFTGSAGIRLGKNSSFTIGGACVRLERGKALVSGTQGCIGAVIATNRGTLYVLEPTGQRGNIKVLQGSVIVSRLNSRSAGVIVNQGQKIAVSASGAIGAVTPLSQSEFFGILSGELFEGFQVPLPNESSLAAVAQQLWSIRPATSNNPPQQPFNPDQPQATEPPFEQPPFEQPPFEQPPFEQPPQATQPLTPPIYEDELPGNEMPTTPPSGEEPTGTDPTPPRPDRPDNTGSTDKTPVSRDPGIRINIPFPQPNTRDRTQGQSTFPSQQPFSPQ
ncbi:hypothetical protein K9N68_30240 [Kovacikia minuta CCNUW1]|uniref:hypothetical protein n=1 Tax=Kovacikia minuta TaxID=2931930 RepID=UPI001CCAF785|nr:hypothetical protein [Kovacikia minuta]UBF25781.1 hypothetical protein K9N68_30240 [Kovacikia minuta CCNUW1]